MKCNKSFSVQRLLEIVSIIIFGIIILYLNDNRSETSNVMPTPCIILFYWSFDCFFLHGLCLLPSFLLKDFRERTSPTSQADFRSAHI